eukprot:15436245-Alexandrium_andersonii.AAC.1
MSVDRPSVITNSACAPRVNRDMVGAVGRCAVRKHGVPTHVHTLAMNDRHRFSPRLPGTG